MTYFGRDFLGAPIHFDSGQTNLAYNFLVSRDAAALPPDAMEGHTHAPGGTMRMPPDRVRQDPVTMTIIVLTALALFALPIMTAERRDRSEAESHEDDPESAALIRDIASLDLRYSRQELETTDYEAVRRSLLRRLHELKGVEERSA